MRMPRNLPAIATNTFTEALRQPIYGVVIGIGVLLLVFAPSLAMFSLDDDNKLLKDVGLSTLLVTGLFLAVFAAATVVTEEIENKTVLTVISKTVGRGTFILGKFIGIAAAVLLAQYILAAVLMMTVRHGVLSTARDQVDWVVVTLGLIAVGLTFIVGMVGNYLYQWRFSSTATVLIAILATAVVAVLAFVDPQWKFNPAESNMAWDLIGPIALIAIAVLILTAIATAAATRLSMVMTLIICTLFFLIGAMAQHWLGPLTGRDGLTGYTAWLVMAIVPNINFYVVTEGIYQENSVPLDYIAHTAIYAGLYIGAVLLLAIALFRNKQVG